MKVAVIGAGWAGLAAAVEASHFGHNVSVFEASRSLGGRARSIEGRLPDGSTVTLDNGQHILIGAYTETLALMQQVGVQAEHSLARLPMCLRFPDATGLQFLDLPTPLDGLLAMVFARGWSWRDKFSLLQASLRWQKNRFRCDELLSVTELCNTLSPRVMQDLIEPLCISALNTPAQRASAQVFLRVLQDALFGVQGGSNLLLPRCGLSALFPQQAAQDLQARGHALHLSARVAQLQTDGQHWQIDGQPFDHVILATPVQESVRLLAPIELSVDTGLRTPMAQWIERAAALQFEAITTVYAWQQGVQLERPMLALRSSASAPAQFVFDRGQLGDAPGLLAFVISASAGTLEDLQSQVVAQAREQLQLELLVVKTVVEKRATFACTPGLLRPPMQIAPGLLACGDYVDGPYPATLEGAVRSGLRAASAIVWESP
jgi:squalene-associated FAD-dependent desaturase